MDSRSSNLDHLIYIPEVRGSHYKRRTIKDGFVDDDDDDTYYNEKEQKRSSDWSARQILRQVLASRLLSRFTLLVCIYLALSSLYGRFFARNRAWSEVPDPNKVDWSKFAYVQYATNLHYLCNSVMLFESLHRLGSKASRVIMYPDKWQVGPDLQTFESKLLLKLETQYGVNLMPVDVLRVDGVGDWWEESFTKLRGFGLKGYRRVLNLDSDSTLLKPMDELFLLPPAPVAMPRAYWSDIIPGSQKYIPLTSAILLVEPNDFEFSRIQRAIQAHERDHFDMDILNDIYGSTCLVIPHRRYILLTGELRHIEKNANHSRYLGSDQEVWDPQRALDEAKFVHFSDWPYPKPWIMPNRNQKQAVEPKCLQLSETGSGAKMAGDRNMAEEECTGAEIWRDLYDDFRRRRKKLCGNPFLTTTKEHNAGLGPERYQPA